MNDFNINYSLKKENKSPLQYSTGPQVNFNTVLQTPYSNTMPTGLDIFSSIDESTGSIANLESKDDIFYFLSIFRRKIIERSEKINFSGPLNKLSADIIDGAFLLQWNYNHFRIFFDFEPIRDESNYGIVMDDQITGSYFSKSGKLEKEVYANIITELVDFVLRNV